MNTQWLSHKTNMLAGITVAMALVPEALAFAIVAGVHPMAGLFAVVIVAFMTSAFGGRPGMVSAAAGSLAVVMTALVVQHGVEYLFAAVIGMGIIQLIIGWQKWGRFIRMVPAPVMLGFVNGLALIVFMAQLPAFKDDSGNWLQGIALWQLLAVVGATMAIIYLLPRLTKAVPSALAAIVLMTLAVFALGWDLRTVGDIASIEGSLSVLLFGDPSNPALNGFHIPMIPFTWESLVIVAPYALILAIIGTTESLLTMTLIDDITQTRGQGNRECLALGSANVVAGMFGTMGGCALIGQSMINTKSGGTGRLSGMTAALVVLLFILVLSDLIEQIPIAALVGLMFFVVIATFEWSSMAILRGMTKSDAAIVVIVTALTVIFDLAIGVISGVIIAALVFAWQHAQKVMLDRKVKPDGMVIYHVHGPLFFASAQNFTEQFDIENDPECVKIDFKYSRVYDHSGVEAIDKLTERYQAKGKKLVLKHLSPECQALLTKAKDLVEVNVSEDPHYHVSMNR
jgi:sulfate permease, SulP family